MISEEYFEINITFSENDEIEPINNNSQEAKVLYVKKDLKQAFVIWKTIIGGTWEQFIEDLRDK